MRVWWTIGGLAIAGCSFPPGVAIDGSVSDGDADAPIDMPQIDRVTTNLVALWTLDENGGATVTDTSGVMPPVVLNIENVPDVTWSAGALSINAPVDINGSGAMNRIVTACKVSDQVTLEAWVTAANNTQAGTTTGQPAHIFTFTVQNIGGHLIGLGQDGGMWVGQVKTDAVGLDTHGAPSLQAGSVLPGTMTHLVVTSTPTQRRLYVDGVPVEDTFGGTLDIWGATFFPSMAGDPNRRNAWLGTIYLVAMYDRALSGPEVMTNFMAGP